MASEKVQEGWCGLEAVAGRGNFIKKHLRRRRNKNENKWMKTVTAITLCVVMLALGAIPAQAEEKVECDHHIQYVIQNAFLGYTAKSDGSNHSIDYGKKYICSYCGTYCGSEKTNETIESHSYTRYDDLGHAGHNHKYRITCSKCGFSREISVDCPDTSNHTKPW